MLIGSHNTMTYLKPRKWWMWFGRFIAKCQNKTIEEQYKSGARWFDLRICFHELSDTLIHPMFAHGAMEYKGKTPEEVFEFLSSKNDAYCRIILEKGNEEDLFKIYVKKWMTDYPNLKVTQIAKKGEWENLLEPNTNAPYGGKDAYASANGYYPKYENWPGILRTKTWSGLLIDDLCPWIYAKLHNKKNLEKYKNDKIILLIDFV